MRVKRGTKRTKRRKKILKQAKGYYGAQSRNYKSAKEAVERSMQFAYRDTACAGGGQAFNFSNATVIVPRP